MSSGILPKDWMTANIVLVYKKGERCFVQNYQPISLTSIVVKVMEKIISKQLVSVLEKIDVSLIITLVSVQIILQLRTLL